MMEAIVFDPVLQDSVAAADDVFVVELQRLGWYDRELFVTLNCSSIRLGGSIVGADWLRNVGFIIRQFGGGRAGVHVIYVITT